MHEIGPGGVGAYVPGYNSGYITVEVTLLHSNESAPYESRFTPDVYYSSIFQPPPTNGQNVMRC